LYQKIFKSDIPRIVFFKLFVFALHYPKQYSELLYYTLIQIYKGFTMDNNKFQEIINQLHANTVTELNLNNKGVNTTQIITLAAVLIGNTSLTKLDLSDTRFTDNAITTLAAALSKNTSLKILLLKLVGISDIGVTALADALLKNNTLEKLSLSCDIYNNINEGVQKLAKALETNIGLKKINLSQAKLNSDSVMALSEALKINTTLKKLDLSSNNGLTDASVIAIANALIINKGLNILLLKSNRITDTAFIALAQSLANNAHLHDLDITYNSIADKGMCALSNTLQSNRALTKVTLHTNLIGDKGAIALAKSLQKNSTLLHLDLGENDLIERPGVEAFKLALDINCTLQSLEWTGGEYNSYYNTTPEIAGDLINDINIKLKQNLIKNTKNMNNLVKLFGGLEEGPLALIFKFLFDDFDVKRAEEFTRQPINHLRNKLALSTIVSNTNGSVTFLVKARPPLLSFQAFREKMRFLKMEQGLNNITCLQEETNTNLSSSL